MEKSWIVYGPQVGGRTPERYAIAKALGLRFIADEWDGREDTFYLRNTLHLAHELPAWARNNRRVLSIGMALAKVRDSLPEGVHP